MTELNLIKVTCAIPRVFLGNPSKNTEEIIKLIEESKDSSIILFPELATTGYTCGDLFFQNSLIQASQRSIQKIMEYSKDISSLIAVGSPFSINGKIYNVICMIQDGKLLGIIPKIFIPENNEYYEKRWFASGKDLDLTINVFNQDIPVSPYLIFTDINNREVKLGAEICEDLWAPNPPSVTLAENGALIILNSSASNETISKANYRTELITQQSARLNCGYLYCSCGYGESTQDLVFGGDALIVEKGKILARSKRFQIESSAISAQIDVELLLHDRRMQASYKDSEASYTRGILVDLKYSNNLERKFDKNPFVPSNKSEREERCEEILNIQSIGLGSRINSINKDTKLVIGVSGGLDSTLALIVSKLTVDKFGLDPSQIVAITMPGFGTTDRTYENAKKLIEKLGAQLVEIPIKDSVIQHLKDIDHPIENKNVVYENAQARERTQILMDYANKVNGIVVGTGDLSELALGWATYNGDHMSNYGVNSSVPKTLVRYLVKYYADKSDDELKEVLYDILDTPVSPELLPPDENGVIQQKTEEKIGPYELHDFFLFHLVRNGYAPSKIYKIAVDTFKDEFDEETIKKWLETFLWRFFTQQFKRSTLPDGPKVGSVTLSPRGDWRMPSDVNPQTWIDELNNSLIQD